MSEGSILLGLDGSLQSRYAAELAWSMAKASGLKVNAQHVIDSLAAWDFLGFDIAGFIGSGPYFAAHETMRNSLHSIGEDLIATYQSLAHTQGVQGECFLDEGSTVRELCWRAKGHDLVILGHRATGMQSPDEDRRRLPRRSVAEVLTHYCPKPLLIVQDRCQQWSNMCIMISTRQIPSSLISSCLDFAALVSIPASLCYLVVDEADNAGDSAQAIASDPTVINDLTKLIPELSKIPFEVRITSNLSAYWKVEAEKSPDTLIVVPVTEISGIRKTPFGTAPELVVRYLNHAAVLIWMQEQTVKPEQEKAVSVRSEM